MFFDEVYKYFVGTFIISCGFFISFKLVDKFVYQPMLIDDSEDVELSEDEKREKNINDYSVRYLEEYTNLERTKLSDDDYKKLLRCFLIEETPLGNVKMYYSNDDESFIYWSEKQVPYKVLEAVSRKYVIDYNCKAIHVDMDEELDKQRKILMDMKNEKERASGDESASGAESASGGGVFANFKKYNTGGSKTKEVKKGNVVKTKNVIVCDNANRYSYRGVYDENKNVVNKFTQDCAGAGADDGAGEKKLSVIDFLNHKKQYTSRYDENNNYDNSPVNMSENDDSASDGFWRFLNLKNTVCPIADSCDGDGDGADDGGCYWINSVKYRNRQEYHSAILKMNTDSSNNGDKDSDNSYDVLECEVNNDEKNAIPDTESDSDDGDNGNGDNEDGDVVESGMRRRNNSVASDVSSASSAGAMKSSWLW